MTWGCDGIEGDCLLVIYILIHHRGETEGGEYDDDCLSVIYILIHRGDGGE